MKEANCISQKATVIITKLNVQCIAPTVNGVTSFYVERIAVDPEFKEKVIPKLKEFYFTAVLPELASPQAVIREPCQWVTEEWKCTYLQLD